MEQRSNHSFEDPESQPLIDTVEQYLAVTEINEQTDTTLARLAERYKRGEITFREYSDLVDQQAMLQNMVEKRKKQLGEQMDNGGRPLSRKQKLGKFVARLFR